jgi:hypothetical protein
MVSQRLWRGVLLLGLLGLLTGIGAGYHRMGWAGIPVPAALVAEHGALMTGTFFGTLIALERAVALRRVWAYLPAWLCGLSFVAFLLGQSPLGYALLGAGGIAKAVLFGVLWRRYRLFPFALLIAGSVLFAGAWVLKVGGAGYGQVLPLLMGFFAVTIVAERLELARVIGRERQALRWLLAMLLVVFVGIGAELLGQREQIMGMGFGGLGLWLFRYDVGLRALRRGSAMPVHRYVAVLLASGYAWLVVTAALLLFGERVVFFSDAVVHSFFVGFVFSMVFAHGVMIFPAIVGRVGYGYTPWLWVPVGLAQVGLLGRLGGDFAGTVVRLWGSWLIGVGIVLFLLLVVQQVLRLPAAGQGGRG